MNESVGRFISLTRPRWSAQIATALPDSTLQERTSVRSRESLLVGAMHRKQLIVLFETDLGTASGRAMARIRPRAALLSASMRSRTTIVGLRPPPPRPGEEKSSWQTPTGVKQTTPAVVPDAWRSCRTDMDRHSTSSSAVGAWHRCEVCSVSRVHHANRRSKNDSQPDLNGA